MSGAELLRDGLQVAILAGLLRATWTDLRWRRIGNVNCLMLTGFAALHAMLGQQLPGSIVTGASVLAAGMLAWQARLVGGGDVKLLAAVAVWAGPSGLIPLVVATALAGGALAVVELLRAQLMSWRTSPDTAVDGQRTPPTIPYGAAICAGAVWVWSAIHLA